MKAVNFTLKCFNYISILCTLIIITKHFFSHILFVVYFQFEVFQEKTRALKETYENQIVELMNEIKHLKSTASNTSLEFSVEVNA